jgi:hypothetical protein
VGGDQHGDGYQSASRHVLTLFTYLGISDATQGSGGASLKWVANRMEEPADRDKASAIRTIQGGCGQITQGRL